MTDKEARTIEETVASIKPLLAGKAPNVQGVILADLTALWMSGHIVAPFNDDKQRKVWRQLLNMHATKVMELTELYAQRRDTKE